MSNKSITTIPVKKKYEGAKRVGIYCRVSSTKKAQIKSLAAQISALTNYVALLSGHVLYDTYFDIASGSTLEGRPGFKRLLADCESGQIQFVLTKSASRFSRDIVVALQAIQKLATTGVTVHFEAEGIDSNTPDLYTHLTAHLTVAEMENQSRSENITWGIRSSAEQGTSKIYNKKCYGYKKNKNGSLVINESEAEVVRLIFRYYIDGHSILSIINELHRQNILSPNGKDYWNKRYIEKMLSNVKYIGDSYVNTVEGEYHYSNHHPAIISAKIFETVQAIKVSRSNIIENPDGTTSRKHTKYSGKRVVRETVDVEQLQYDLGFEEIITPE